MRTIGIRGVGLRPQASAGSTGKIIAPALRLADQTLPETPRSCRNCLAIRPTDARSNNGKSRRGFVAVGSGSPLYIALETLKPEPMLARARVLVGLAARGYMGLRVAGRWSVVAIKLYRNRAGLCPR
jgi:hypothetical protein